jgi:hypothetical protein
MRIVIEPRSPCSGELSRAARLRGIASGIESSRVGKGERSRPARQSPSVRFADNSPEQGERGLMLEVA